ncbi:MAG: hypothetical protein K2K94_05450 [Muribaculaceae bacterium]|nr:hypothetical protein [Muribaculaceae bacterium]
MNLRDILSGRLSQGLIAKLSSEMECEVLYSFIDDENGHVSYNALWVITHWDRNKQAWLAKHRNELIDLTITCKRPGKRRLLMTLIERMDFSETDVRSDFIDFCLGKINSTEPSGIRSLAIKLAYAQCRFYPELITELLAELELLNLGDLSPALQCSRRNILKKINA